MLEGEPASGGSILPGWPVRSALFGLNCKAGSATGFNSAKLAIHPRDPGDNGTKGGFSYELGSD